LRSLYFALAGMLDLFKYLKVALAAVLALIGAKMLTAAWLKQVIGPNFNLYLLGVVLLILTVGVVASVIANRRERRGYSSVLVPALERRGAGCPWKGESA
jgi:tellurite resistance protein TerC